MAEIVPHHITLPNGGWLGATWHQVETPVGAPVLLVAPPGCEYERCHRVMVAVASRLAGGGVPCLRLDLSGCGESSSNLDEVDPARWEIDVAEGIAEALRLAVARKVVLAGIRLACRTLVEPAITEHPAVSGLALWEPVLSGGAQMNDWLVAERTLLAPYGRVPQLDQAGHPCSCLGHPISRNLSQALMAWRAPSHTPNRPVTWIGSARPAPTWARTVDCNPTPFWDRDPEGELIPAAAVATVTEAITALSRSALS